MDQLSWTPAVFPEYTEYGTGLALTTTQLCNGIIVELQRDPSTDPMIWTAYVDQSVFGAYWEAVYNAFDDLFYKEGRLMTMDTDPQEALTRLDNIVQACAGRGLVIA